MLTWGRRQVIASLLVLIGQLMQGSFQHLAMSDDLRSALGEIVDEKGREFELEVNEIVKEVPGFQTLHSVTRLGDASLKKPIDLGDIDVLASHQGSKTLFAIECKDLQGALTPADVASDLKEHFEDVDGSSIVKHQRRVEWLESNIEHALKTFGIDDDTKNWKVSGLLVTGTPVMAPHFRSLTFPVVVVDGLTQYLERSTVAIVKRKFRDQNRSKKKRRRRR